MESVVIVNGLTRWGGEFVDRGTGEVVRGTPYTKLFFISKAETKTENKVGFFEANYKGDFALFDSLKGVVLPAEIKLKMEIRPDSKGNASVWIVGAEPVRK